MLENTIKVSKIEIQIGKTVISLSPDELKELKRVLDETLPEDKIKWPQPSQPIYIPVPYPATPHLPPTYPKPYFGDPVPPLWTVTCGNQSISYNEAAETMRLIF